ncbi:MAG: EMC3/TMCO1 family protein [Candidatus Bathyarchaeia archaeon]|jgi:uncharacterized membrane protein (DUF106 family)|nr:DUF106 domain-containing protein [Candidatus Bathyarchaeota archaeon A05DMB-4]MDH7595626.1 EMC3/TMCO1 family protein [Candidatus Bathyarchaeota archaeon]
MWLLEPTIPNSTIFVFLLALLLTLITSLANRLLTNREQLKSWRKEISDWQKEFNEARKSGDKKQLEKVMRRQKQVMQIQSKMFTQQMKVSLIFIIPFFLIWTWLNGLYVVDGNLVAVAYFPGVGGIPVFYWYLLCSLSFGALISRLLGLGIGMGEEQ